MHAPSILLCNLKCFTPDSRSIINGTVSAGSTTHKCCGVNLFGVSEFHELHGSGPLALQIKCNGKLAPFVYVKMPFRECLLKQMKYCYN